ncbi:diaminopimelate decarboxylase [Massiliimalia massiliensis]|uniref:diaminopimelate decarboxylase n=1 Tax=Massiliimalia massiliensis TaxID=1852384 RepID=UPI000986C436|nr:diaminopimelate decarboxylase [Massiliimalia massiliensis]
MFVSNNLSVNGKGHLTFADMDTTELAGRYGTPLYVMDEEMIRENMRQFRSSMDNFYQGGGLVCYASKAFSCKEIYRIAKAEGLGVDVVSIGELYTAMSVNFPAEKICYHGNNKTEEELSLALDYGVGWIVADSFGELELLNRLAENKGKQAKILLRLTPGIEAHTHSFIQTGQIDSKFGFTIEFGTAKEAVRTALSLPNLVLDGVHCHIGSQIFEIDPFVRAAEILIGFIADIRDTLGYDLKTMNLGGGFGIKYIPADHPAAYQNYMREVSEAVKGLAKEKKLSLPYIIIEPGRSIVGAAGITLYQVGGVKEIPGIRKYVSIDGGMTDNPRYALYEADYEFILANKASQDKNDTVTVAGRCCESGDLLGKDVPLQQAEIGDILAVCATGAYNYSMASHYNRVRKPAVVMVKDGTSRIVVRRETLDDMISCDI